jgi:hypothetical protein
MGDRRVAYRDFVGRPEGKSDLEDVGVDGRIILHRVFKKWDEEELTGLIWLRIETDGERL